MIIDPPALLDVNLLAYRAACNEALPSAERPAKPRVLSRLSRSEDAKSIAREVGAMLLASDPGANLSHFWASLSADPRWKILVLEIVTAERGWGDLVNAQFHGRFWDWGKALVEKWWDVRHPATRTAGMAIISILSAIVTSHVIKLSINPSEVKNLKDVLQGLGDIPLRIDVDGSKPLPKIQIDASGLRGLPTLEIDKSLPKLQLDNTHLTLDAQQEKKQGNQKPGATDYLAPSSPETIQLKAISETLSGISQKLRDDDDAVMAPDSNAAFGSSSLRKPTVVAELIGVDGKLTASGEKLDNVKKQVETSELQNRSATRWAALVTHLTLVRHGAQSFVLPVVSGSSVTLTPVRIQVVSFSGSGASRKPTLSYSVNNAPPHSVEFDGSNSQVATPLNATIVLNSSGRRVSLFHPVQIAIIPNFWEESANEPVIKASQPTQSQNGH